MSADEPAGPSVTTRIEPALIRRASRRFFWLRMRLFIVVTVGLCVVTVALAFAVESERLLRVLAVFLLVAFPLVWLLRYDRFRRLSERSFADFFGDSVTWRFDDETMAWHGARMQSRVAWSLLRALYLFPEFWVMHYRNNSFNVVPAGGIDVAVRDFVRDRAAHHGAKIVQAG